MIQQQSNRLLRIGDRHDASPRHEMKPYVHDRWHIWKKTDVKRNSVVLTVHLISLITFKSILKLTQNSDRPCVSNKFCDSLMADI